MVPPDSDTSAPLAASITESPMARTCPAGGRRSVGDGGAGPAEPAGAAAVGAVVAGGASPDVTGRTTGSMPVAMVLCDASSDGDVGSRADTDCGAPAMRAGGAGA